MPVEGVHLQFMGLPNERLGLAPGGTGPRRRRPRRTVLEQSRLCMKIDNGLMQGFFVGDVERETTQA